MSWRLLLLINNSNNNDEKRSDLVLTVIVFGEARSEALQLVARSHLLPLDVRVAFETRS